MSMQLGGMTIDCADPHALARFWTAALDLRVEHDWGTFLVLTGSGTGPAYLGLQRVSEPRAGKNRAHLDFNTEDRAAEVRRLVGLGATEVAEHTVPGLNWTVLRDPEGNEFCVGSTAD